MPCIQRAKRSRFQRTVVMSSRATYICDLCIEHGKDLLFKTTRPTLPPPPADVAPTMDITPDEAADPPAHHVIEPPRNNDAELMALLDDVTEKLQNNQQFSDAVMSKICSLVAIIGSKFVGEKLASEYDTLFKYYKDTEYMQTLDPPKFLAERNKVLLSFLQSIVPSKDPNSFQLAMLVERVCLSKNAPLDPRVT